MKYILLTILLSIFTFNVSSSDLEDESWESIKKRNKERINTINEITKKYKKIEDEIDSEINISRGTDLDDYILKVWTKRYSLNGKIHFNAHICHMKHVYLVRKMDSYSESTIPVFFEEEPLKCSNYYYLWGSN